MSDKLKRLLALMLAGLMMMALLAGCGDDEEEEDLEPPDPELMAIKDDPLGALNEAFDATMADVQARYAGSPLPLLAEALCVNAGSYTFALENGETTFSGVFQYDESEKKALLDGLLVSKSVNEGEAETETETEGLPVTLYYEPAFIGVSIPSLFGDDSLLGLRPVGIAEQLEGSVFARLFSVDVAAFEEFDAILEELDSVKAIDLTGLTEEAEQICAEFTRSLALTVEKTTATRNGQELEGYALSAAAPNEDLADFLEGLFALVPAESFPELQDAYTEFQTFIQETRENGADTSVSFLLVDGKIWHISAENHTAEAAAKLEIEFYGDGGNELMVTVENGGEGFTLTSIAASSNGYSHTLSVNGTALETRWEKDGALSVRTLVDGAEDCLITGTLNIDKDGEQLIFFEGLLTQAESDAVTVNVSLASGAAIDMAYTCKNITEMTEAELYAILMNIVLQKYAQ